MEKRILLNMMNEIHEYSEQSSLNYCLAYGSLLGAVREKGFIKWDDEIDISICQSTYEEFVVGLKNYLSDQYELVDQSTPCYELPFARVKLKGESHHDLHVDLFPLIGTPNSETKRFLFVEFSYIINKIYYIKKLNSRELYKNRGRKIRYYQSLLFKIVFFPIPLRLIERLQRKICFKYDNNEAEFWYTFGGSYKMREVFDKTIFESYHLSVFETSEFLIPKHYDKYLKQVYGDYMTPRKDNYLK